MDEIDREFTETTTLHGINHLAKERSIIYKIVWFFLIIGSAAVCAWQITKRIQNYLSYPTTTTIEVQLNESLPFPAVTICMPLRYNWNNLSENDKDYVMQIHKMYEDLKLWATINATVDNKRDGMQKIQEKLDEIQNKYDNFSSFFLRISYKINDKVLKSCRFAGYNCSAEDFRISRTASFDSCWTFNAMDNNKSSLRARDGVYEGLEIILDLEDEKYDILRLDPGQSIINGISFYVHPPYEFNYINGTGYAFSPGFRLFAAITYHLNENMEPPYGKCAERHPLIYFKNYTFFNCILDCILLIAIHHLKCEMRYSHDPESFVFPIRECTFIDHFFFAVETNEDTDNIFSKDKCLSSCTISCKEEIYNVYLSQAQILDIKTSQELAKTYNTSLEYLRNNYAFLHVYFKTLLNEKFTQTASSEFSGLVSDIGGQLGLFLGMSILTLIEVLEYFIKRFIYSVKKIEQNVQTSK